MNNRPTLLTITAVLAAAVLGAAAGWAVPHGSWRGGAQVDRGQRCNIVSTGPAHRAAAEPVVRLAAWQPTDQLDGESLMPEERVSISVYERVNRSVVHINTLSFRRDNFFFFEMAPEEGSGSGVVIDQQGHLLTNYHVIEDARVVEVTLYDASTYRAELVGADVVTDIAILHIDAPSEVLHPVALSDSSHLKVGQRVYAIGNPFGLERTLSTGIISSLNRSIPSRAPRRLIKSIIQVDAAINPGNSGGPLLNTSARMIGMNTAIASRSGQSAGVGFAIPSNTIRRIAAQLIERGRVVRPDAGIARVYQTEDGLLIAQLVPDGPAEAAGLRGPRIVRRRQGNYVQTQADLTAADLIVAVDGQRARTVDDFLSLIEAHRPGEQVTLTVIREGQQVDVALILTEEE